MSVIPDFIEPLGEGVYAIDTGFNRPRFDAAYLLVHRGRAAFVDTGTNYSVPRLLQALTALGLEPGDVDFVIPTHVHLDHAGGVGLLMQHLPHAQVLVHPRGARHLIDPTALYMGATAVYGVQEMERSYGRLQPVPTERVQATHDGLTMDWAGRPLRFLDTPGHARHHHCIWDAASGGWFTGDTFGLSYRVFDHEGREWIIPTTTPVQFEPEPLKQSIRRLLEADPRRMYLTHYGMVTDPQRLGQDLLRLIDDMVDIGLRHAALPAAQRHAAYLAALRDLVTADLGRHGISEATKAAGSALEWLALDLELNAQGLAVWADRLGST